MHNYKKLEFWKKSHQITLEVYQLSKHFPVEERYNLTSQIRRSALSVPSNIAEGSGMKDTKHFIKYLNIARGSAFELEYQLLLAKDLQYINESIYKQSVAQVQEIQKMIYGFSARLHRSLES